MDRLLLVENNTLQLQSLKESLELSGFEVGTASCIAEARARVIKEQWGLVVLDGALPDGNGIDFCGEVYEAHPQMPVILVASKGDEKSVVEGLSKGATDYLKKPYSIQELTARIKRHLARSVYLTQELSVGKLRINITEERVMFESKPIELRKRELAILVVLARRAGNFVTRENIVNSLDDLSEMNNRTIDAHIHHLRNKLKKICGEGVAVETVRGSGYKLVVA